MLNVIQLKSTAKPYTRKTMQLVGSAAHSKLRLSFQAAAAARLTVLFLDRAASPRPTLSAVARRAILDYAQRVEAMSPEERIRESRRVNAASRALPPAEWEQEKATTALEAAEESAEAPLPTLQQVTCAPERTDPQELELRVNQLLKCAMPRKYRDLRTK